MIAFKMFEYILRSSSCETFSQPRRFLYYYYSIRSSGIKRLHHELDFIYNIILIFCWNRDILKNCAIINYYSYQTFAE